jgi:hypothetical protein
MDDLHAGLCALPVELKELILSKIEHIEAHHILALSLTFEEAFSLLRALPRTFDFEGVEGVLADHLVNVLDDDRVRSLGKERALELLGDGNKDRLCEYACGRSFEVLQWAHNELDLPWAPCLAGRVSDEFLALRVLRETWPQLKRYWRVNVRPEEWRGVTMENGRVVKLVLVESRLTGAVPAEIGQLTSLRDLHLRGNQLTSLPEEIRQLTSLRMLSLDNNQLTRLPAGIGQLRSLEVLNLTHNQLASVPAEIGQLASLRQLSLSGSRLTRLPAEIGQLASLTELRLYRNQLTSLPAEIGQLRSLTELRLGENKLTSVPAEIGQLAALRQLSLSGNRADELAGGDWAAQGAEEVGSQRQSADEPARGDWRARVADGVAPLSQSADEPAGGDRAAQGADEVGPRVQSADERASCDTRAQCGGLRSDAVNPQGDRDGYFSVSFTFVRVSH